MGMAIKFLFFLSKYGNPVFSWCVRLPHFEQSTDMTSPFQNGVLSLRQKFTPHGSNLTGKNLLLKDSILSFKIRSLFGKRGRKEILELLPIKV